MQVDTDHRREGELVEVKLYSVDDSKQANPLDVLLEFTMKTGEKYLIFDGDDELMAEEKKHFCKWKTISNLNVSPHKNIKKCTNSCKVCPY